MMPAGLAMIAEVVPEDRRPGALAVYTGVGQAFATVGPLVGGLCAQYLGWRWGFLVDVPVGVTGLVLLALARPATPRHPGRVLLDLGLFRIRPFTAAASVLFALGFAMTAATIYGAAALQDALHLPPAAAGAALLPLAVPLLLATHWAARNHARVGPRALGVRGSLALALGLVCAAAGLATDHVGVVVSALVPAGVGIGLLLSERRAGRGARRSPRPGLRADLDRAPGRWGGGHRGDGRAHHPAPRRGLRRPACGDRLRPLRGADGRRGVDRRPRSAEAEDRREWHVMTLATPLVCHSRRSWPGGPSTGCARARGARRASGTGRCASPER